MASPEEQIAALTQWKVDVEKHLGFTDAALKQLQDERTSALKWGIITLGTAVLGMAGFIAKFVLEHLQK